MTNPPPVAPVEGPLYLLFTEYENITNIRKWSQKPFYGAQEYVPVGELERLRAALKRMLLEFDFMIEANMIADVRNDVIFVEARAALQGDAP